MDQVEQKISEVCEQEWITIREAALRLGVSPSAMRHRVNAGRYRTMNDSSGLAMVLFPKELPKSEGNWMGLKKASEHLGITPVAVCHRARVGLIDSRFSESSGRREYNVDSCKGVIRSGRPPTNAAEVVRDCVRAFRKLPEGVKQDYFFKIEVSEEILAYIIENKLPIYYNQNGEAFTVRRDCLAQDW